MARREIHMNEVMEILYQWHQGTGIKGIQKSLGYDRKTVRRYVRAGLKVGLTRAEPFPDEQELIGKLKELWESQPCLGKRRPKRCYTDIGMRSRSF